MSLCLHARPWSARRCCASWIRLVLLAALTTSALAVPAAAVDGASGPGGQILTSIGVRPGITLVGTGSKANPTGDSITVPLPAGIRRDDQIVVAVTYNKSATPVVPAGYTPVGSWPNGQMVMALWRRTASASEPASLDIKFTNALLAGKAVIALVYRGVDPAHPVVDADGSGTSPAGTSVTVPGLDASGTHDQLVTFAGGNPLLFTPTWTPPAGHTLRQQVSSLLVAIAGTDSGAGTTTAAGSNGPSTFGLTPAATLVSAGLVLRQAPAPQRWFHHDQIGSVRMVTDEIGDVVGTASYTPYGKVAAATGELGAGARFGFAGEYTDPGSGLIYLRARHYDPATAQFLSRDPLLDATQDPYAYAANDPANLTDPTGQHPGLLVAMAIGALSGGLTELGMQVGMNLLMGCPAFHDIAWGQVALGAALGAVSGGATAQVAKRMEVRLFRNVDAAEFDAIAEHQEFTSVEGMFEGKWFATSGEHADEWGRKLNGGQGLTVETRIPRRVAKKLHYRGGKLDGIGPAWFADAAALRLINKAMDGIRLW